jgi:ABC-type sugar transport system substrate-binding protein
MLPRTRKEHILREVQVHGSVRSSELAEKLGVNGVTIRRDISELAAAGLLSRVRGGALVLDKADRPIEGSRPLVGLLVPSRVSYFPEVVRGMELMAAGRGARLVLGVSHYDRAVERTSVDRLVALGARGLILAPTVSADVSGVAEWLGSLPVPIVLLERMVDGLEGLIRRSRNFESSLAVRL